MPYKPAIKNKLASNRASKRAASSATSKKRKRAHFIGIGGIGMSSLARWFLAQNWLVTGSDAVKSPITQELVKGGIKVKIGHNKVNFSKKADLVVASAAVPLNNPELTLASKLGIKIQRYSEALGDVTRKYKTIAVCGSHGKSSTTAMVATIFIKAKLDPTVVIGTKLNGWNFRAGKSEWLIMEADEYNGAFWNYKPWAAIVTNIDFEHVDFYKNLTAVKNSFFKFLRSVDRFVVANKDDKNTHDVSRKIKTAQTIYFSASDLIKTDKLKNILKVPGKHNIMNALAAWKLAEASGINETAILKALASYGGVWRRIEYKGRTSEGIKIFDDYAHHPTEIRATLQTLREKYPKSKIICVFQPHQQKRLTALYKNFISAFTDADHVLITDIYRPKGRDEVSQNINSKSLVNDINKFNRTGIRSPFRAVYIGALKNIPKKIKNLPLKKGDVIVLMGAGDVAEYTPPLLKIRLPITDCKL